MEWLPTTLKSILLQQDVDFDVVLVDDGNPEPIARQIRELASRDPRVRGGAERNQSGINQGLDCGLPGRGRGLYRSHR
jgi:glycosyltransferase involved in cell wall biosynthesis